MSSLRSRSGETGEFERQLCRSFGAVVQGDAVVGVAGQHQPRVPGRERGLDVLQLLVVRLVIGPVSRQQVQILAGADRPLGGVLCRGHAGRRSVDPDDHV